MFPGQSGTLIRGWFWKKSMKSCGTDFRVAPNLRITHPEKIIIGDSVWINTNCNISSGGGVVIGDNVIIGPDVKIWSINHNYDDVNTPINRQGWTNKEVTIGNDVWIASNAVILPGADIPDGSVIGAGSIVTPQKLEPYAIYAGNPIKRIRKRGKE